MLVVGCAAVCLGAGGEGRRPATPAVPRFVTSWGHLGTGKGEFQGPWDVCVTHRNTVLVTDHVNGRVQEFDSLGTFRMAFGSWGTGDGQMVFPEGVAVDRNDNIYVADSGNNRIQVFDSAGRFLFKWGSHGRGDGQFSIAQDVAVSPSGTVYVIDDGNSRVQVFDSLGTFIRKWGRRGPNAGEFESPTSLVIDSNGNVYVSDNTRIQKFDALGEYLTAWSLLGGEGPVGMGIGPDNAVFATDVTYSRIEEYTSDGVYILQWGGPGTGDGEFIGPNGVAKARRDGLIYVTDHLNHRVQAFWQDPTNVSATSWSSVKTVFR